MDGTSFYITDSRTKRPWALRKFSILSIVLVDLLNDISYAVLFPVYDAYVLYRSLLITVYQDNLERLVIEDRRTALAHWYESYPAPKGNA